MIGEFIRILHTLNMSERLIQFAEYVVASLTDGDCVIGEFILILHTLNMSERFSSQNSYTTYRRRLCGW